MIFISFSLELDFHVASAHDINLLIIGLYDFHQRKENHRSDSKMNENATKKEVKVISFGKQIGLHGQILKENCHNAG